MARNETVANDGDRSSGPTDLEDLGRIVRTAFPRPRIDTVDALVKAAEIRTFRPTQIVVAQGDEIRTGLVLDGHVALRRMTLDGRDVIPRIVTTGQLAPPMAIVGRASVVEAVALSTCRVAVWQGHAVQMLAAADTGLALDLLDHVLLGFEGIVERLDGLLYQDSTRRIARVLDEHADIFFSEATVLTRAHLPALVGTSREMTGRVLRSLESAGIVARTGRNRLRLLDPDRLSRVAAARASADGRPSEPARGRIIAPIARRRESAG